MRLSEAFMTHPRTVLGRLQFDSDRGPRLANSYTMPTLGIIKPTLNEDFCQSSGCMQCFILVSTHKQRFYNQEIQVYGIYYWQDNGPNLHLTSRGLGLYNCWPNALGQSLQYLYISSAHQRPETHSMMNGLTDGQLCTLAGSLWYRLHHSGPWPNLSHHLEFNNT